MLWTHSLWISVVILFIATSTSQETRRFERSVHWGRPSYSQSMIIGRFNRDKDLTHGPCRRGCYACDVMNGCFRCRSRMFLHFHRRGSRHIGVCMHDCPQGFYGKRGRRVNTCKKCEVDNCKTCFTSNYCTSCHENFYLHAAKCQPDCPNDLKPNNWTRSCDEEVDCVVGPWSAWGKCTRRSSRSCKYGKKRRNRKILQQPTNGGKKCPKLKEARRCRTPPNKCPLINNWILAQMKRRQRKKKSQSQLRGKKKRKGKDLNLMALRTNEA